MSKHKIIEAAIVVLNEDLSAPLDKIALKAGLSRRTLHRYFSDRQALLEACMSTMMQAWKSGIVAACSESKDPVRQLELMLYAGIDCGVKYAFLNKLRAQLAGRIIPDEEKNEAYEKAREQWFSLIPALQRKRVISGALPAAWIRSLFTGMVTTTVEALESGSIAPNDARELAWYSLRRSIGMN